MAVLARPHEQGYEIDAVPVVLTGPVGIIGFGVSGDGRFEVDLETRADGW